MFAFDLRAKRFARSENMFLPDVLVQSLRTHAIGKGPIIVRQRLRWKRCKIEQTHAIPLCLNASNSAIETEIAAFSDSTFLVATLSASEAPAISGERPAPSEPTASAKGTLRLASVISIRAVGESARNASPEDPAWRRNQSRSTVSRNGIRKMDPAAALKNFGFER